MNRAVKYWVRLFGETLLAGGIVALALLLFHWITGGSLETAALLLPWLLTIGCGAASFLVSLSAQILYIPLTLSFGSTRREAFVGFLGMRLLMAVVPLIAALLLWNLFPVSGIRNMGLLLLVLFVLLLALGHLGSITGLSYRIARLLGALLTAVPFGIFGGFVGGSLSSGAVPTPGDVTAFADFIQSPLMLGVTLSVGAVSIVLDIFLTCAVLRKSPVKL